MAIFEHGVSFLCDLCMHYFLFASFGFFLSIEDWIQGFGMLMHADASPLPLSCSTSPLLYILSKGLLKLPRLTLELSIAQTILELAISLLQSSEELG